MTTALNSRASNCRVCCRSAATICPLTCSPGNDSCCWCIRARFIRRSSWLRCVSVIRGSGTDQTLGIQQRTESLQSCEPQAWSRFIRHRPTDLRIEHPAWNHARRAVRQGDHHAIRPHAGGSANNPGFAPVERVVAIAHAGNGRIVSSLRRFPRVRGRAISARRWAIRPSRAASPSCTARSSTWSATSSPTRASAARTKHWNAICGPIWSSSTTWA